MTSVISSQTALVYLMLVAAMADGEIKDSEIQCIQSIVANQPIFGDYPSSHLNNAIQSCQEMLEAEEGLEAILSLVKQALPEKLIETGYAFACDVVAADGVIDFSELEWLKMVRKTLHLNVLISSVLEYSARARFRRKA